MKVIFDVDYRETEALAAAVLFKDWRDGVAHATFKERVSPIAAYEPGSFYKREMPCILQLMQKISDPLDLIIIDGFVWLGPDHPGLGVKLYEALDKKIPVIGVAKTSYHSATPLEVLRGVSKTPLLVTAIGMDVDEAAQKIQQMHGDYRIPTLLKLVDQTCRGGW